MILEDLIMRLPSGIPFVCKTTHLEKMKNVQQAASARRNQRQMENGNATEK